MQCSYLNHTKKNCKFNFGSACKHCSGSHFSFLCMEGKNSKNSSMKVNLKSGTSNVETVNSAAWIQQFSAAQISDTSILPTFTCVLNTGRIIRAMKDSGCQANFVEAREAEASGFEILKDNFLITVNGFNDSKKYVSKLVNSKCKLGGDVIEFPAVCIPQINLSLKLPKLGKAYSACISNGYSLADKLLNRNSTENANVKLILGTESSHIIPISTTVLENPPTCILRTPYDIMLEGNLDSLLCNLEQDELVKENPSAHCMKTTMEAEEFKVKQSKLVSPNLDLDKIL